MRAINANVMKQQNRRMVLDCIRRRPVSRAELSDETQLTRASITQIVDALMVEGYVAESAAVGGQGPGRRQTQLTLVENSLHMAGVNLSHTGYQLSIVNLGGRVLWSGAGKVAGRTPVDVLREIAESLRAAILEMKNPPRHMFGAGLCAPGPMDCASGTMLHPPGLPHWHGVPVVRLLEELLRWKVHPANISNAHALEEKYFGIGRESAASFMILRIDETVGAGIVQNGHLLAGPRGQSPDFAHVSFDRNGPECSCGNRGCLERYLSFPAALEGTPFTAWQQVIDGMDTDPAAAALFDRFVGDLSFAATNILNVFCLDKIVLSGDLVYGGERLAQAVNQRLAKQRVYGNAEEPVVPGDPIQLSRLIAMPAYHAFFH